MTALSDIAPRPESGQNLRLLWSKVKRYWYLFALSLIIASAVAYWYLKVTAPLYQVEAQVLIKDIKLSAEICTEFENRLNGQLASRHVRSIRDKIDYHV